jgi:hypothetical protein
MKRLALSIALVVGGLGCELSTHCDPDQIYMNNNCFDMPPAPAEAGANPDAMMTEVDGGDGAGDGDGGNSCTPYQGFGDTCTDVSQCSCGLDSCNTFMNANYCTHTRCLADPSVCPPGWTCLDLSAFDPTTGSACLRP